MPISWWRFLLITALIIGLYFAVRFIVTPPQTHPALLLPAILLGAVLGALVATWEATADEGRRGDGGSRRERTASEARWYLFGLTGLALVLAPLLPATTLEWLVLGLTALTAGGAGHAWVTARSRARRSGAS